MEICAQRAIAELVEERLRVIRGRGELGVHLAEEADETAGVPGEEGAREKVAEDDVPREEPAEGGEERPPLTVGQVAEDPLEDDRDAVRRRVRA